MNDTRRVWSDIRLGRTASWDYDAQPLLGGSYQRQIVLIRCHPTIEHGVQILPWDGGRRHGTVGLLLVG
jgi:hypothetical protein